MQTNQASFTKHTNLTHQLRLPPICNHKTLAAVISNSSTDERLACEHGKQIGANPRHGQLNEEIDTHNTPGTPGTSTIHLNFKTLAGGFGIIGDGLAVQDLIST